MRHCRSCARPLPKPPGVGRPPETCGSDRCATIFISGHGRKQCARCRSKLPRGRQYQRMAICGPCFVDLTDLVALMGTQPARRAA